MSRLRHAKHVRLPLIAMAVFFSAVLGFTSTDQTLSGMADVLMTQEPSKVYDLSFDKFEVKKVAEPTAQNLNTVYEFEVKVKNNGEAFEHEQVFFNVDPVGKSILLAQKDGNFSLKQNRTHKIEEKVSVPFYVAEQKLVAALAPYSFEDPNPENTIEEFVAKTDETGLRNIKVGSVSQDGRVSFDFDMASLALKNYKYSVLSYDSTVNFLDAEEHHEVEGSYYTYAKNPFGHETLDKFNFDEKEMNLIDKVVYLNENLFSTKNFRLLVIKAENEETGAKVYSDFIYLSPQNLMDRASLARHLVQELKIANTQEVVIFYEDVSDEDWFKPFVKSVYAAGYLEADEYFRPYDMATRGEVAEVLSLAFDLPLVRNAGFFEDVSEDHKNFHTIHALKAIVPNLRSKTQFAPDEPATTQFVNLLIDALSKLYKTA